MGLESCMIIDDIPFEAIAAVADFCFQLEITNMVTIHLSKTLYLVFDTRALQKPVIGLIKSSTIKPLYAILVNSAMSYYIEGLLPL